MFEIISFKIFAGCEYGDKSDLCYMIEKRDCYNKTVFNQCCDTCERDKNLNFPGKRLSFSGTSTSPSSTRFSDVKR